MEREREGPISAAGTAGKQAVGRLQAAAGRE